MQLDFLTVKAVSNFSLASSALHGKRAMESSLLSGSFLIKFSPDPFFSDKNNCFSHFSRRIKEKI